MKPKPQPQDERIVVIIRDSTGALIRMHGTTRGGKARAIERFKRDHGGKVPEGFTVTEKPTKKGKRK
jgi:hypothetical protein